jgi:hypothetical protein
MLPESSWQLPSSVSISLFMAGILYNFHLSLRLFGQAAQQQLISGWFILIPLLMIWTICASNGAIDLLSHQLEFGLSFL